MAATATVPVEKEAAPAPIEKIDELRALLQVVPPDQVVDWLNLLIYGDPGVGKTYFLGTALDHVMTKPALVLDVEGGITTLRKRKDLDVKRIRSLDELDDVYTKVWRSMKNGKVLYNTICIDSGTELADLTMKTIMDLAYNANPDKVHKDVPSPREWGILRSQMRKITRAFKDLPCNFIMTATLGQRQDEGQPIAFFPGFGGKLQREIPGFMDIVGMMTADADPVTGVITRKIQVQGTKRVVAKDRTSSLGGMVEEPSIPKFWDMIMASNE